MSINYVDIFKNNSRVRLVTLEKGISCESFWAELTHDMYYNSELEKLNIDVDIRNTMRSFATVDYLDMVNKAGRILKRFAKYYKEQQGVKLPDSVMGIIGDRLQYYAQKTDSNNVYYVDFTNCFDWNDGMFGKSGSCYWGQYSDSIPTLQDGGAWCIRFYSSMDDERGIGRTWILPKNGLLMCFNSYGIERPIVSRCIKAIFAESGIVLHYKKTDIYNSNNDCIPYINSRTGFILYPEGINESELESRYDIDLDVKEDEEHFICEHCGTRCNNDESNYINDSSYCDDCTGELFSFCDKCQEYCDKDDVHTIHHRRYDSICRFCAESINACLCDNCGEYDEDYIITDDGDCYCQNCDSCYSYCEQCEMYFTGGEPSCNCTDEEEEEESTVESTVESVERDFIDCNLETVYIASNIRNNRYITSMIYRHSNIPGLFVYKDNDGNYILTHESSGCRVCYDESLDIVLDKMTRLCFIDWTIDGDTLANDSTVTGKILAIIH